MLTQTTAAMPDKAGSALSLGTPIVIPQSPTITSILFSRALERELRYQFAAVHIERLQSKYRKCDAKNTAVGVATISAENNINFITTMVLMVGPTTVPSSSWLLDMSNATLIPNARRTG